MSFFNAAIQMLAAKRADSGWLNAITGRGTARDVSTATRYQSIRLINDEELRSLYYGNAICSRVVNEPVLETKRAGFKITNIDNTLRTEIEKRAKYLHSNDVLFETACRGRAFGGALACMSVVGAGDTDDPMIEGAQIESIRVVDRRRAFPVAWYDDPSSPDFGDPSVYAVTQLTRVSSNTFYIHASKCIRFDGIEVDEEERLVLNGWSYSVLQLVYEALKSYDGSIDSISTLMNEASIGVYKIKDLINMVTGGKAADVTARMQVVDMVKNTLRGLMLDADNEDYSRESVTFSGLDSASDRIAQRLTSTTGMPLTKLLGTSPAGLSATGESDMRGWYNTVDRWRCEKMHSNLQHFYKLIAASIAGPSTELDELGIEFGNLWTPTAQEQSTLYKTTADADNVYFSMGMDPERIFLARFSGDSFSAQSNIQIDPQQLETAIKQTTTFDVPKLPSDTDTTTNPGAASGENTPLELTPSAYEAVVKVFEARALKNLGALTLPDGSRDPDNDLTVSAYRAKQEAQQAAAGEAVGSAEGEAVAAKVPGVPTPAAAPVVPTP